MTPERKAKLWRAIDYKQHDLCLILENVLDVHNIGAVLRTCDAVGIREVYVLYTANTNYSKLGGNKQIGKRSSASALKWLDRHYFEDTEACFAAVRKKYQTIYTTHIGSDSSDLYDLDLTQSMALVFGNERNGVSPEAVALSDGNFLIPQVGMIRSLNISVACAVTLYEAYRQRKKAGFYEKSRMTTEQREAMFADWKER